MTVDASIANLDEDESLEPRDSTLKAVLGATALEGLGFMVDQVAKKLIPRDLLAL